MDRLRFKREKWLASFLKGAVPGNNVKILRNGEEAFPEMFRAIEKATDTINLEFYKIHSDNTGWGFARRLARKQEDGCAVRVIYDSIGCIETDAKFFEYLRDNGVRVLEFHPVVPFSSKHWGWWQRDHRKMLIIDGRIGFVGGINLTDEYAGTGDGGENWRDTDVMIEGPAVRELQRLFISTWNSESREGIGGRSFFPLLQPAGDMSVRILGSKERRNRRIIRRAYIRAIKNARDFVYIANAYFVPDRGILRALRNARKRGVNVFLMLPQKSDIPAVRYASCSLYSRLLRWGVRLFEWQKTVLHAKTAVIDGMWSTVGSYNIDRRSFTHNLEVNVSVLDERFGSMMKEMFVQDLMDCREINMHEWRRRPWLQKVLERMFHLIRHWL